MTEWLASYVNFGKYERICTEFPLKETLTTCRRYQDSFTTFVVD